MSDQCPICGRVVPENLWENHHLVPKSKKGKETIRVCVLCGDALHQLIPLKEMTKRYNTLEKIMEHPKVQNWVKWIETKPNKWALCFKKKK